MKRKIVSLLTVSFIILIANSVILSQTVAPITDYWFNIPSCPLKIHIEEKSSLHIIYLENLSEGVVTGYETGCITEKNGAITLIKKSMTEKVVIKAFSTKNNTLDFPTSAHGNYFHQCLSPSKVAVITVNFADGGIWTFKKDI